MPDWHELVIDGPEPTMRGLVAGFAAGRGERVPHLFGSDLGLEPESLGERLKALFLGGSHHVVFVPAAVASALVDALAKEGGALRLALERQRVVESASFSIRAEIFSPELAAEIRRLLQSLPSGIRADGLSENEEKHPEARGPEPFAPLHSYAYRVSGRIVGTFEGVIQIWGQLRRHDFVEISPLRVEGKIS